MMASEQIPAKHCDGQSQADVQIFTNLGCSEQDGRVSRSYRMAQVFLEWMGHSMVRPNTTTA
jgi:hypothetical protein